MILLCLKSDLGQNGAMTILHIGVLNTLLSNALKVTTSRISHGYNMSTDLKMLKLSALAWTGISHPSVLKYIMMIFGPR